MRDSFKYSLYILIFISVATSIISCVPVSKLKYLNDINELQDPPVNPREQKLIGPFDNLYIKVYSIDEKTNQLFNSSSNMSGNASSGVAGYLVDEMGKIDFPFIGEVSLGGLSLKQAGEKLDKAVNEVVNNASVDIKYMDNKVTVLGEVQRPGTYSFNQHKVTIYEALGLGGGISQFGDHKKVVLVRQEGDKIMHHKLDLSDSKIAGKDYFYILNNDLIIVEPMKYTSWYRFNSSSYATALTTITFFISIFFIFKTI